MDNSPRTALKRLWKFPDLPRVDLREREWVYFVQSTDPTGLIKIGRTRTAKWRLLQLQTHCPVALKLVAIINAPAGTEGILHEHFAAHRQHGEWFAPHAELLQFIAQLPRNARKIHAPEVLAWAPQVNCNRHFERAARRPSETGRRKRVRDVTLDLQDQHSREAAARLRAKILATAFDALKRESKAL